MTDQPLNELVRVAYGLQQKLDATGRPHCIIGGLAVQHWGESRVTHNVDAVAFTDLYREREFAAGMLAHYEPRRNDGLEFAMVHRVLLMRDAKENIGIDLALGAFEYDRHAVERAVDVEFESGVKLRTCTAEDLIIYKAFANRVIDWHDINGILIRQRNKLDFDIIQQELEILSELKEDPSILQQLEIAKRAHV